MDFSKLTPPTTHLNSTVETQHGEQIPNRSTSNRISLIPPVTTNRNHSDTSTDELNKNIGSDYQDIQIRTLTKWINVQLSQVGEHINGIDKDLKDGKKLLKLLSVVSNNNSLKPERGHMRIHELSNVAQALKFLQDQWGAENLPAVGSEAIVNGDVKSTLAITFFIMLKYQIHPILNNPEYKNKNLFITEERSSLKVPPPSPLPSVSASRAGGKSIAEAKLALLYWVRSQLEDYVQHNIIATVQDFSRSWRSGLAFCLLVHRHDPNLIPTLFTEHIQHASEKETWNTLLILAFDIAAQSMNIPKYLEPADLLDVDYPHEPSVMMYVCEFYKAMSQNQEEKDVPILEKTRLHDISLVSPLFSSRAVSDDDGLLVEKPHHPSITPPDSTTTRDDDDDEEELPSTPQPELVLDDDVYQQLDTLSSLLTSPPEEKEIDQQLLDNQKSRLILDHANRIINKLDPSSEEKQVLSNRYNQLRLEWEILSKRLQEIQHTSNYVNESDETMYLKNQLKECNISIHPLDGTADMAEEFERAVSHFSKLIQADVTLSQNESLVTDFVETESACQLFRRGITFLQLTSAINDELSVVQQLMSDSGKKTSAVTDDLIQSLEQRIHIVNTTIQGVREEYGHDLLLYDTGTEYYDRFVNRIDDIEDRYEVVRDWVDQVRVWFVEAERIRKWIDQQIRVIEERNEADTFNPVSRDITIADEVVIQIHEEHERLKHEIDHFDSDDMNRLRAHVKMLTPTKDDELSNQRQELTPADTSTIEITLTTLNRLNHLTQLLNKRSHLIQLLLLRVKWEDLFGDAVQWIAQTDGELDVFLNGKARWSEKDESSYTSSEDDDQGIEGVIKTLVSLERKIGDFDHGAYSDVLDAYQEMETLKNESLPDYLEVRQLGFEKAFEDLMKRSGFSRKVVEQLLSMINNVEKFKKLRDVGENLRHQLSKDSEDKGAYDDIYAEQVQAFKEDSARLITNASTNIPYPSVPEMSTAIGANDAHDNQITNENIRSTISAYSMSLALIADGLDQLLTSRYQIMSLQERTKEAYDAMSRVKLWMDERIKLLEKSRFDILLYGDQNHSSSDSSSTSEENSTIVKNIPSGTTVTYVADEENLLRLEKERDSIALRLQQMEYDELTKLFDTVRALEYDVDASNAVSIDRDLLVNAVESLEKTHQQLKDILATRSLELDALKKRIDWETQWSKSNSHLHTIARKLCDFNVKKARYDPSKENIDKPSYANDRENIQSLQFIQDRITELVDRHLTPLYECYQEMQESYSRLSQNETSVNSGVPDIFSTKQATLKFEYDDLKHLSSYTSDLMTQRATMTEFLLRAHDAQHEGEKIKDVISKKIRRIMVKEEEDGTAPTLDARVVAFKQEVKSIWEDCGSNMPFPVYNGNWLRSTNASVTNATQSTSKSSNDTTSNNAAGSYRSQVRAQIKALIDKKIDELKALEKSIDQSLGMYQEADHMKSLVSQYEQEACQLGKWINEQIEALKSQHIDVSAESFLARGLNISDLKKSRLDLFLQVDSFESKKVKALHDQIARLVEDSVEKKKNQSVDVSSAARHLGEVMTHLSELKRGLSDQAITLEAASMRAEWEENLKLGITKLEEMNEQLRLFNVKKNQWIARDELDQYHVNTLQQDLSRLISQKNKFEKTILPSIQLSYDAFVEYFPKLSRPIATPDHLEARMESLSRTSLRFQENVAARSKELDLIKQRIRWEDTVKQALAYLSQKELLIETFVEEKARWNINSSVEDIIATQDDDEEAKLRNEWHSLYTDIKNYEEDVIAPLQKRFDSLVGESTDHYNNTNVTVLPNAFMKKKQDIQVAQNRAEYFLNFSNEVVSQRCLVSAFILRTAQLEQSAELIREEFIATKISGAGNRIAGLLEGHTERLQKFKDGIEDVRQNLASSIPYPIRSLENMSTQSKIKDETTNSVILETIEMRNTRLDEICSSLQQLLESKERVSRRKLSLHSFKKQAEVTEAWIDSRRELLSRSNSFILQDNDSKEKVDVEKLKEAVSQADSVERAMKANETVFTSLVTSFDKCINAFEDKSLDNEESQDKEHDDMAHEITNIVKPTQDRIHQAWNDLLDEAGETTKNRTALLIENRIQTWFDTLNVLSEDVNNNESKDDDQISWWSDALNKYEQEQQSLNSDVELNKAMFNEEQSTNISTLLSNGIDLIKTIRSRLSTLQNELHLNQLIVKYLTDISNLESAIQSHIDHLNKTNETHMKIDGDSTSDERETQHQHLTSEYKLASDKITDLKDSHDDIHGQYNVILSKDNGYSDNRINIISEKWKALQSLETTVSALVSRSSKWIRYFDSLLNIRKDLETVQVRLEKVLHLADDEKDATYKELNTKLDEVDSAFKSDVCKLLDELVLDSINAQQYNHQKSACSALKDALKSNLNQRMTEREKLTLIQSINTVISRLSKECNDQLDLIQNHSNSHDFNYIKSDEEVKSTIGACSDILKATSLLQSNIQNEVDTIRLNQCQHLITNLGCTEDEVNDLIVSISQSLKKLQEGYNSEEECLSVSRTLSQYLKLYNTFMETIGSCISKISTEVVTKDTLSYFGNQLEILDENKKQLYSIGEQVVGVKFVNLYNSEKRSANLSSLIESYKQDVNTKFNTFAASLEQSKLEIEKMKKREAIIAKLNDLILFVANTSDRVHSLQLSGKNGVSASEEREFKELCQEFYQTLEKKTKFCDTLIANFEEAKTDKEIDELKERLASDTEALKSLISFKEKEASDEGDLSEFLNIMIEFDLHITILTAAIENASPHHSTMVNSKFVKSDLQGLLRSLVVTYKEHKEIIIVVLEKANNESKKQFLGDNERVKENIQKANKKWTQVQAAAAARERELQTCISNLDHEFFTKLAMAKSTKKPRSALPPQQTPLPVKRQPTPSNGRYLGAVTSFPRRSFDESSKRPSKTPIPASSSNSRISRAAYVPDPKNPLDMQLGHIVNSYPHRITVKIVPDQVGKYWFGDENPRLVYCRILPSKLVMVRVGGGWVELSKFLREHGLTEGAHSRPASSQENIRYNNHHENVPFLESYVQALRSSSPSSRVTIRGGGGVSNSAASTRSSSKSSGSRSRSPLPGFVDGDKFISLDEAGNHVVVKMKKADIDAKTPIIKKKDKN